MKRLNEKGNLEKKQNKKKTINHNLNQREGFREGLTIELII